MSESLVSLRYANGGAPDDRVCLFADRKAVEQLRRYASENRQAVSFAATKAISEFLKRKGWEDK